MKCFKHSEIEAIGACVYCGKFFCTDCLVDVNGKFYCKDDLSKVFNEIKEQSKQNPNPMVFMNAGGGGGASSSSSSAAISQPIDNSNPKSKTKALILCGLIIFGFGGFHRFYTGHTAIGIIQLLTGGGCLIWQIIDFISILSGGFRDVQGKYLQ